MRILLIEDEARIAQAIKRSLMTEHFAVDVVADADSGLSYALSPEYDLIILDRMLPGDIDGLTICRKVRQNKITTPILMLTALGSMTDKLTGLENGADDYMVKPFSMAELIMRTKVLLRRPKSSIGPIVKAGDLEINLETFKVTLKDLDVKLSPREFKLLAYLGHNKDKIVSKDSIILHAWDDDADILPNTVEVYIAALRKKFNKVLPGSQRLINTVHGFGYKLGDD